MSTSLRGVSFDDDNESTTIDCPICLDPMEREDRKHMLQCQRHCGYNFCQNCIESLLNSSKDGYQEASDGNLHVKVFLHCPNCRSDLTPTIRDTLLLRKAHAVQRREYQGESERLTDSQKRLQRAMKSDKQVKEAITKARQDEARYLGHQDYFAASSPRSRSLSIFSDCCSAAFEEQHQQEIDDDATTNTTASLDYEEWGVEADLDIGVHDSIRLPSLPDMSPFHHHRRKSSYHEVMVDRTLFAAWDDCLKSDQQRHILSGHMTSGKTDRLAKAAQILYNVIHDIDDDDDGVVIDDTSVPPHPLSPTSSPNRVTPIKLSRRSSVLELIAESRAVQAAAAAAKKKLNPEPSPRNARDNLWAETIRFERDARNQVGLIHRYPLPVRMPKAVAFEPPPDAAYNLADGEDILGSDFELVDYTWDGTVLDAFNKISIGFRNTIHQRDIGSCLEHAGVQRILGEGNHRQVEVPGQSRVLILNAGEAGRQGAVRGDVLTHIVGKSVQGMTAAQVRERLCEQVLSSNNQPVMVTLNAERSVAKALKLRSIAIVEGV